MMTSPSVSSAQQEKEKEKEMEEVVEEEEEEQPKILKLVNRKWKALPQEGEKDVYIRDPKLKEGHIGDLDKKSIVQLQEILERQDRILNNRFLSSKLKDKGKRLRETRQKVAEALERALDHKKRAGTRTAAAAGTAAADINAMEWKSRRKPQSKQQELDSDDDEEEEEEEREDRLDPLKLMAYHSSSVKKPAQSRRRDKEGKEEEEDAEDPTKAIVQELMQLDLQDAAQEESQSQSQSSASCEFRDTRSQKLEEMRRRNGPVRDSFKPFRPIDNPQPIPGVVHHTARPTTTTTVCIPLQEALQLEREYLIKEKERALSDTKEQLGKRKTKKIGLPPAAASSLKYRDANMNRHILDSDEDEESDSSSDFNDYGDE